MFSLPVAFGDAVTDGSFEAVQIGSPFLSSNPANIPGWTHSGALGDSLLWAIGYTDSGGSVTVAGDGNQFVTVVDLITPASATWTTTIAGLTPGNHVLSFDIAVREVGGPQSWTVSFTSGSSTACQTFTAPAHS